MEQPSADQDGSEPNHPMPPSDDPLAHVVDDLSPKEQCADWVLERILAGRTPEEVTGELIEQGWSADEAEELVEHVRKVTRHERGVVTRDDVVRDANRRYRQSWSPSWFSGLPTLSSGVRLLSGLRSLFALKKARDQARDEKPDETDR